MGREIDNRERDWRQGERLATGREIGGRERDWRQVERIEDEEREKRKEGSPSGPYSISPFKIFLLEAVCKILSNFPMESNRFGSNSSLPGGTTRGFLLQQRNQFLFKTHKKCKVASI